MGLSALAAWFWLAAMAGHWIWTERASLGRWWSQSAWLGLAGVHLATHITGLQVGVLALIALSLFLESVADGQDDGARWRVWWWPATAPMRIALLLTLVVLDRG